MRGAGLQAAANADMRRAFKEVFRPVDRPAPLDYVVLHWSVLEEPRRSCAEIRFDAAWVHRPAHAAMAQGYIDQRADTCADGKEGHQSSTHSAGSSRISAGMQRRRLRAACVHTHRSCTARSLQIDDDLYKKVLRDAVQKAQPFLLSSPSASSLCIIQPCIWPPARFVHRWAAGDSDDGAA